MFRYLLAKLPSRTLDGSEYFPSAISQHPRVTYRFLYFYQLRPIPEHLPFLAGTGDHRHNSFRLLETPMTYINLLLLYFLNDKQQRDSRNAALNFARALMEDDLLD